MNEAQAGFTKSRLCPGQIFALNTIIDLRKQNKQPTFCAYLDLAKVFDSVNRKLLFETMETREVDKNIVRILRQMYAGEESAIIMNNNPTKWIKICKGDAKEDVHRPYAYPDTK